MIRYSMIQENDSREIVLPCGTGCCRPRWTFCDFGVGAPEVNHAQ